MKIKESKRKTKLCFTKLVFIQLIVIRDILITKTSFSKY